MTVHSVMSPSCTCTLRSPAAGHDCPGLPLLRFSAVSAAGTLWDCRLVGQKAQEMSRQIADGVRVAIVGMFSPYQRPNRFSGAAGMVEVESIEVMA